jgi:hypothetical protein
MPDNLVLDGRGELSLGRERRNVRQVVSLGRWSDLATRQVATSAEKDTGPVALEHDDLVLLLGAGHVRRTKQFSVDHGLVVAKSFGSKYVEFESPGRGVHRSRRVRVGGLDRGPTARVPCGRCGVRRFRGAGRAPRRTRSTNRRPRP